MNIEELMNSRKRLEQFYKKELEKSKSSDNKDVYEGELRDIEKEIAKIDALIEIYNNCISKHPQYMLIQLEKLYLWVMSGLEREDYLKLSEEEIADLFNHNIPDGWTYDKTTYPVDKKIQYLEAAICSNSSLLELEGIFHL